MAKAKNRKPAGPKDAPLVTVVGLKGTAEFKAWVERLCRHVRLPLPTMFEHALIEFAKTHNFGEEPPERAS